VRISSGSLSRDGVGKRFSGSAMKKVPVVLPGP
jgi:hypothetical protein